METIKANELRINDWVESPNDFNQVLEILDNGVFLSKDEGHRDFNNIKPIPLTEDWLKRAYFYELNQSYYLDINEFNNGYKVIIVNLNDGYVYLRQGRGSGESRMDDDIITLFNSDINGNLYLHYLQNLYFALTQNELTIK